MAKIIFIVFLVMAFVFILKLLLEDFINKTEVTPDEHKEESDEEKN